MKTDTIAAIATAMSNSGIGIVRLSGKEAVSIIDKIFVSAKRLKILVYNVLFVKDLSDQFLQYIPISQKN